MIEDMQLEGFAERTQKSYMQAVRQLAEYYNKLPDRIIEEELRQYFLCMKNVKKVARSTITLALCGIKFFYERTMQHQWATDTGEPKLSTLSAEVFIHRFLQHVLPKGFVNVR
jgi:site-specific recombinase XerD